LHSRSIINKWTRWERRLCLFIFFFCALVISFRFILIIIFFTWFCFRDIINRFKCIKCQRYLTRLFRLWTWLRLFIFFFYLSLLILFSLCFLFLFLLLFLLKFYFLFLCYSFVFLVCLLWRLFHILDNFFCVICDMLFFLDLNFRFLFSFSYFWFKSKRFSKSIIFWLMHNTTWHLIWSWVWIMFLLLFICLFCVMILFFRDFLALICF
jgi:hypothetical protein